MVYRAFLLLSLFLVIALPATGQAGLFDEVLGLVRQHFWDPDRDWQALEREYRPRALDGDEAVNAMLGSLGISHTRYYSEEEPEYYELRSIFGHEISYVGVLMRTQVVEGERFVSAILEGGPAEAAGLRVGDRIVAAEGAAFHPVHSWAARADQQVVVEVQRVAGGPIVPVRVTPRRMVPVEAFLESMERSATFLEQGPYRLGYIRIWCYAGEQFQELLEDKVFGDLADADGLMVDLRGGWGGASPEYLRLFCRRLPVLTALPREGAPESLDSQWRKPVLLLVDEGTRSGKEILAYGFREYGIGKVVGTRTAGAVSFGKPFVLHSGGLLYLAVARALVDGEELEGIGVEPDVVVPAGPLPYRGGRDLQLDEARRVLAEILDEAGCRQPGLRDEVLALMGEDQDARSQAVGNSVYQRLPALGQIRTFRFQEVVLHFSNRPGGDHTPGG